MAEITVIGGVNIDIEGNPYGKLIPADSNPGKVNISFGGVGRNIVENVARLGGDVAMISVTGEDFMGKSAKRQLESIGVDASDIMLVTGENTGMYLSILNHQNDMELAICDMDILENITPEFLDQKMDKMKRSKIVAMDCNLKGQVLDYITNTLASTPLFLDPVSVSKAERVKPFIGRFHTIKPNRIEAELLCGFKITDERTLQKAGSWFSQVGVSRVFISLGENGAYYKEGKEEGIIKTEKMELVSATGAGDAFSAAILVGHVNGMTAKETAQLGVACASIAMEAQTAVNEKINLQEALQRIE